MCRLSTPNGQPTPTTARVGSRPIRWFLRARFQPNFKIIVDRSEGSVMPSRFRTTIGSGYCRFSVKWAIDVTLEKAVVFDNGMSVITPPALATTRLTPSDYFVGGWTAKRRDRNRSPRSADRFKAASNGSMPSAAGEGSRPMFFWALVFSQTSRVIVDRNEGSVTPSRFRTTIGSGY